MLVPFNPENIHFNTETNQFEQVVPVGSPEIDDAVVKGVKAVGTCLLYGAAAAIAIPWMAYDYHTKTGDELEKRWGVRFGK